MFLKESSNRNLKVVQLLDIIRNFKQIINKTVK